MNDFQAIQELLRTAREILSTPAEREVEKLLKAVLKGTIFSNKAHAVGGYVRDQFMGLDAKDLDIVVEMRDGAKKFTNFLHDLFPSETSRPRQLGAGYPIWQISFKEDIEYKGKTYKTKRAEIEVADTQKESFPDKGSRQRVVEYGTLEEDIARRDFTTNMLLKDLTSGEIKDLTGVSKNDIKKGILRGHPTVDFNEILAQDPLRMLRLVRFQTKYGWDVPLDVLKTVRKNAKRIQIVSNERIRDELIKIMKLGKLGNAVKFMKAVGLLKYVLPEIDRLRGVNHDTLRGHHQEGDVWRHTLLVLNNAKPGVENQLAALLHDVGKPETREILDDKIRFLGHEDVGGEIAEAIVARLKFEKDVVKKVGQMVRNHMKPHNYVRQNVNEKTLRRFIRNVGEEMVDSILDLAEADQLGNLPSENKIPYLREKIDKILHSPVKVENKPILNGREIMKILGIKPGPMVGKVGRWLLEKADEYAELGKKLTKQEAERLIVDEFEE